MAFLLVEKSCCGLSFWVLYTISSQIKASSEIKRHKTLVTCLLPSFYPLIAAAVCQGPGQGGQMRSPGDNRELIPATNIIYNSHYRHYRLNISSGISGLPLAGPDSAHILTWTHWRSKHGTLRQYWRVSAPTWTLAGVCFLFYCLFHLKPSLLYSQV